MYNLFDPSCMSGAEFSECKQYRYGLWRKWDIDKPNIMFIGLNPSTATATMDDPTIRRVKRFAMDWGYGGVYMCNLFAYISPYPEDLKAWADPVAGNDYWLLHFASMCKDILFAWGSFPEAAERARIVSAMFPKAVCLGLNKNRTPKHPLYIAANTKPIIYQQPH